MNILVTGGAGYLGSVLIPKLLIRGHHVRVLDVGYFGTEQLQCLRPKVELIREDIRSIERDVKLRERLLKDCDCIIHLAAISNDPSAELNPELTREVNLSATATLADVARFEGIKFLFSSSCSVYGEGQGTLEEDAPLGPLTTYAVSKMEAEQVLLEMASDVWQPVILRNGTLFGYSPRMRFDLVVNIFALYSCLHGEIRVFGDGQQWRPFLHVSDCARAFVFLAENNHLSHVIYNVSHENQRVIDVAEIFQRIVPKLKVTYVTQTDPDVRDYRVDCNRLATEGFQPRTSLEMGSEQLIESIVGGRIRDPESIFYRNAKWLKELTTFGEKDPQDVLSLLETLVGLRTP